MTEIYTLATLWLGLALLATLLSIWLRIATAMAEILVGTVAQQLIGAALGGAVLGSSAPIMVTVMSERAATSRVEGRGCLNAVAHGRGRRPARIREGSGSRLVTARGAGVLCLYSHRSRMMHVGHFGARAVHT